MNAEEYQKAWIGMNPELEKDTPGIRLNIPSIERIEKWLKENEQERKRGMGV